MKHKNQNRKTEKLFLTYKCTSKPLPGNLFAVDRIFFGRFNPVDIQYGHTWKLKTSES